MKDTPHASGVLCSMSTKLVERPICYIQYMWEMGFKCYFLGSLFGIFEGRLYLDISKDKEGKHLLTIDFAKYLDKFLHPHKCWGGTFLIRI